MRLIADHDRHLAVPSGTVDQGLRISHGNATDIHQHGDRLHRPGGLGNGTAELWTPDHAGCGQDDRQRRSRIHEAETTGDQGHGPAADTEGYGACRARTRLGDGSPSGPFSCAGPQ